MSAAGDQAGAALAPGGGLEVRIRSGSVYLSEHLPVSIRDSSMRLVESGATARRFQLPPGLYQVSAVLEDGQEHSQLVRVDGDALARVELGLAEGRSPQVPAAPQPASPDAGDAATRMPDADAEQLVELLAVDGADLVAQTIDSWSFQARPGLDAVASARFRVGRGLSTISLPVSPEGGAGGNTCVVRVELASFGHRVGAWIAPHRRVASTLQNMLAQRQILNAAEIAGEATDLLRHKYADPTGAALGAVILDRVGRLQPLRGWLHNLVRDFPWLPDGKVLLACLLAHEQAGREQALALAVAASGQRLLYTDAFTILLDLLRRWPAPAPDLRVEQAIARLAAISPHVDWQSICLSHCQPE